MKLRFSPPRMVSSESKNRHDRNSFQLERQISVMDGHCVNATDPDVLSRAEIEGRRQALEYARFLVDCVSGYEKAALAALSTQIGLRETRRVYGDYRLTRDDVLSARQFEDQIGLCGAPIEDHHDGSDTRWEYLPQGQAVGIPYRCLIVRDARNVLVAGRCFSATHDAHASVRSMAQCRRWDRPPAAQLLWLQRVRAMCAAYR